MISHGQFTLIQLVVDGKNTIAYSSLVCLGIPLIFEMLSFEHVEINMCIQSDFQLNIIQV